MHVETYHGFAVVTIAAKTAAHFCNGSPATDLWGASEVRLCSDSDTTTASRQVLRWANMRPEQLQQKTALFDYLVGATEQRCWYRKTQRLGSL
jgi:hypothetical protein